MTPEAAIKYESLVDRAGALHEEIAVKDKELKEIKRTLAGMAEYKEGSKTGHVFGQRYHAVVSLKTNVKWDQDALDRLRRTMGDPAFFRVFKWAYEPVSKKVLDGAIDFGEHGEAIRATYTETEGSPQVTFKLMEEC
jgi:hypothetical protein